MNIRKTVAIGATVFGLVSPAQLVLAGPSGNVSAVHGTAVPKEEFELRILEEQIRVLRDKLYMRQGKMTNKQKVEWHKRYNQLKTTLSNWNDSIDGIH